MAGTSYNSGAPLVTRRNLIQQKLDNRFVGRAAELSALSRVIQSPASCGFINIYGISGIGKSTLLAKLLAAAQAGGSLSCLVDLAFCRSRISLITKLSQGLTAPFLSDPTNACLQMRQRYIRLHRKLVASHRLPPSLVAQISRLSEFDGEVTEADMGPRNEIAANTLAAVEEQLGDDFAFFRDPTSQFAHSLVLDINALAVTQLPGAGLLIAFDRSEAVSETILSWFRDEIFSDLADNVGLVVAGQRQLADGWDDLLQFGYSLELKQMGEPDIASLASNFGIQDQRAIGWIYRASGGVPLLAEAFCRSYLKDPHVTEGKPQLARPPEAVVDRYLAAIAPGDRELVQKAALLRYVSNENTTGILGPKGATRIMSVIGTLPYVAEGAKGYVIHDRVRGYLNGHFQKHNPKSYAMICAAAADYYATRGAAGIEVFESLTEELYYRIRADADAGLECLREGFSRFSLLNQPQECETLVEIAVQADLAASLIAFFRAVIRYQRSEYQESLAELSTLVGDVMLSMDDELRQQVLFYCAVDHWYLCNFPAAMDYARRALDAFSPRPALEGLGARRASYHYHRSLGIVALTQDRLGHFAEGITSALKMADAACASRDLISLGYAMNSAGYFSWHEGDWCAADSYLAQSITTWSQLRNKFGGCYPLGHRSALRVMVGDPAYGTDAIARCVALARTTANQEMLCKAGYAHAEALWGCGRYEECIAMATDAIAIAEQIGQRYFAADALRVKAMGCLMQGDEAAGIDALRQSLSIAAAISAPYIVRRSEGIAYGYGLHQAFHLPEIDLLTWIGMAATDSFARASLDQARFAVRTGKTAHLGTSGAAALGPMLAGALASNFNAFLMLSREMTDHGLTAPGLDAVARIAAGGFAAGRGYPGAKAVRDCIERSARRGLKGDFNGVVWDRAMGDTD